MPWLIRCNSGFRFLAPPLNPEGPRARELTTVARPGQRRREGMKRWTTFWNYNAGCGAYNDNQTAGAASGTGYARKLLLAASLCLIVLSGCNPRTTGEVGREPTVGDLLGM